jgi:hypothetical protein
MSLKVLFLLTQKNQQSVLNEKLGSISHTGIAFALSLAAQNYPENSSITQDNRLACTPGRATEQMAQIGVVQNFRVATKGVLLTISLSSQRKAN